MALKALRHDAVRVGGEAATIGFYAASAEGNGARFMVCLRAKKLESFINIDFDDEKAWLTHDGKVLIYAPTLPDGAGSLGFLDGLEEAIRSWFQSKRKCPNGRFTRRWRWTL